MVLIYEYRLILKVYCDVLILKEYLIYFNMVWYIVYDIWMNKFYL